jgi:hypothetical protein
VTAFPIGVVKHRCLVSFKYKVADAYRHRCAGCPAACGSIEGSAGPRRSVSPVTS